MTSNAGGRGFEPPTPERTQELIAGLNAEGYWPTPLTATSPAWSGTPTDQFTEVTGGSGLLRFRRAAFHDELPRYLEVMVGPDQLDDGEPALPSFLDAEPQRSSKVVDDDADVVQSFDCHFPSIEEAMRGGPGRPRCRPIAGRARR